MSAIINLALNAIESSESDRAAVAAGKYDVDAVVRVSGTLSVGADYDTTPTVSLPVKEILALFVARAGFTRERSMQLLVECVHDAIAEDGHGAGEIAARVAEVDDYLSAIKAEILDKLPRQPRKGAVKAKIAVEVLETEPACV